MKNYFFVIGMLFILGCDWRGMARNHAIDVASQQYSCPRERVIVLSETGYTGDVGGTWSMDICGNERTYAAVRNAATNRMEFEEVSNNEHVREGDICSRAITIPGRRVMTAFFRDDGGAQHCMDYFVEQGWRISSTRRARGSSGDSFSDSIRDQTDLGRREGWGIEVMFVRDFTAASSQ